MAHEARTQAHAVDPGGRVGRAARPERDPRHGRAQARAHVGDDGGERRAQAGERAPGMQFVERDLRGRRHEETSGLERVFDDSSEILGQRTSCQVVATGDLVDDPRFGPGLQEHRPHAALPTAPVEERVDARPGSPWPRRQFRGGRGDRGVQVIVEPAMQLEDECGSVGEVHVEGALRQARLAGDLVDAEGVEPVAIGDGTVSTELAAAVGRPRPEFKVDVRKLKALGLTESLEVGYRLTRLGRAVVRRSG